DRRLLLTDGNVDTLNAFAFLVDDGVDGQSGFTGLTVTDDQLTLATANRYHGVNGFVASFNRLVYRSTGNNARRNALNARGLGGVQRAFAVDRVPQSVNRAAQHAFGYRDFQNAAGAWGRLTCSQ